jgi:hypothetical protein
MPEKWLRNICPIRPSKECLKWDTCLGSSLLFEILLFLLLKKVNNKKRYVKEPQTHGVK